MRMHLFMALAVPFSGGVTASAFELGWPVDCVIGKTCVIQNYLDSDPGPAALDYRCGGETYQGHNGVDIRIPSLRAMGDGINVLAAAAGRVVRMRDDMPDHGADPAANARADVGNRQCGNGVAIDHGDGWETQYCHMRQGSIIVRPGESVVAGAPLGHIGLSGDTVFPHVHLSVRHNGRIVDPFDPEKNAMRAAACTPATPPANLWNAATARQLAYRSAETLNVGFATGRITMADVESGRLDAKVLPADVPALVFFGRAIHLLKGDRQRVALLGPDGAVLAQSETEPVEREKAQVFAFAGKSRAGRDWPMGTYTGRYTILRNADTVASAVGSVEIKE